MSELFKDLSFNSSQHQNSQPIKPAAAPLLMMQKSYSCSLQIQDRQDSLDNHILLSVQNNDVNETQSLLAKYAHVPIQTLHDSRKYTLLHLAAQNNSFFTLKILIEHYKKHQGNVSAWVNEQSEDGFTPLHLAAYRGNLPMIEFLIENGADMYIKNRHGMNTMHISAQGDQPVSLVYFRNHGVDSLERDQKGGTPLHWAAYYGCEQATNYLLSFKEEGLTPLHLAVLSGNSRVVKRLIVKGADKTIRDRKLQTPSDKAKENEFHAIVKLLNEEHSFFSSYLNLRVTNKSKKQMLRFMLLYLLILCVEVYFDFYFQQQLRVKMNTLILYVAAQFITILLFLYLSLSNPGFLRNKSRVKVTEGLMQLLRDWECFEVCPECVVVKVPRSKHCDFCNNCVKVYDHHCPWIDNCVDKVGSQNHCTFFIFVFLMTTNITVSFIQQIYFFVKMQSVTINSQMWEGYYIYAAAGSMAISLCITGIFLVPVWMLFLVQSKNLLLGKTTYERFSSKNSENRKHSAEESCSLRNCYRMCCQNKKNPALNGSVNRQSLQMYHPLIQQ